MFVSVEIAADLGRAGVTVPAAAIQQTEAGPIAFVQTAEDRFEKRALTLGVQRTDWVEVRSRHHGGGNGRDGRELRPQGHPDARAARLDGLRAR